MAAKKSIYNLNPKRQKELDKLKGKPTGESLEVIFQDKYTTADVYDVDRSLLRLNPKNGRFGTGLDRLVGIRRRAGIKKPAIFNMDDLRKPNNKDRNEKYYDPDTEEEPMGGDVNQIRNMIKGTHPSDKLKRVKYSQLFC